MNRGDERAAYRVALIGCGFISRRHLTAWRHTPGVHVVAVCDADEGRAKERAREFDIPHVYTDAEAMLRAHEFDIVDIATRPESHEELVRLAAAARAAVLCQKPLAADMESAVRIVETCKQEGVRLMATENWRWHAWYQEAKKIIESGRLGRPLHATLSQRGWSSKGQGGRPGELTQSYFKEMPRLVLYEFGIHLVDVMRFLLGDPVSVHARTYKIDPTIAGEDAAFVHFDLNNGCGVTIEINWSDRLVSEERLEVLGTHATLQIVAGSHLLVQDDDGPAQRIDYAGRSLDEYKLDSHVRLHRHFAEALRSGQPFATEGEDNLKTLQAVFDAYESAARTHPH